MSGAAPLTLVTAGHVDHGKTALVAALTGRNTDRLPEEQARGLSIELGYAPFELPSGRRVSIVDVPGHERFVRTMVAGSTGVDLFLLCVAADDCVMPQTYEHLAVLKALGVDRGVVAITKSDLAAPARAIADVAELLPGIEAVPVAAPRGRGLGPLRDAIARVAASLPGRADAGGPDRLHVDRSFTLKGIGTVVTGTLWSGEFAVGDRVQLLPHGREARVRSVHVHDVPVERAVAGQRTALNLSGVARDEVRRGDLVCAPGGNVRPIRVFDAVVEVDPRTKPLDAGTRIQVHHGTRVTAARIVPLDRERVEPSDRVLCQLRLETPLMPDRGDRFVLRRIAPPDTLGGGEVLDPRAGKHGGGEQVLATLRALERGEPLPSGADSAAAVTAGDAPGEAEPEPLGAAELALVELLLRDGDRPRADGELAAAAGLDGVRARAAWRALEQAGVAVRLARNLHYHVDRLIPIVERVLALCERDGSVTIATVRDELATSRRYAQALLEYLDGTRRTVRHGDVHVIRRRVAG